MPELPTGTSSLQPSDASLASTLLLAMEARDGAAHAREVRHARDVERRARVVVADEERADALGGSVGAPRSRERGAEDDADRRAPFLGEADHHAELAVLRDEVARAVDGIDEERRAARSRSRGTSTGRSPRPRSGCPGGSRASAREDERVRLLVGARDRIVRALHLRADVLLRVDAHDELGGAARGDEQLGEDVVTIDVHVWMPTRSSARGSWRRSSSGR